MLLPLVSVTSELLTDRKQLVCTRQIRPSLLMAFRSCAEITNVSCVL